MYTYTHVHVITYINNISYCEQNKLPHESVYCGYDAALIQ